jgi:hypothetical protein
MFLNPSDAKGGQLGWSVSPRGEGRKRCAPQLGGDRRATTLAFSSVCCCFLSHCGGLRNITGKARMSTLNRFGSSQQRHHVICTDLRPTEFAANQCAGGMFLCSFAALCAKRRLLIVQPLAGGTHKGKP